MGKSFAAGPPNGEGGVKRRRKYKRVYSYTSNRVAGTVWVGVDAYLLYAFCYNVVWHHVRPQNRGAAIAILAIFGAINLYVIVSFVAIHAWGPGRITSRYRTPSIEQPNAPFLCDEQGYSFYCSECQSVKPNRAHHSAFTNTCVPNMDHLCPWIGHVVGQGNRKFFLQFVFGACVGQLLVLITLFIYQHDQLPHINGNSIAIYILCGIGFAFTFSVFAQHFFYVLWSHTTLEHMQYRRYGGPFINLAMPNGQRQVVPTKVNDVIIPRASPFDLGTWRNVCDIMGPVYTWVLPIRPEITEPMISEASVQRLCGDAINQYCQDEKLSV